MEWLKKEAEANIGEKRSITLTYEIELIKYPEGDTFPYKYRITNKLNAPGYVNDLSVYLHTSDNFDQLIEHMSTNIVNNEVLSIGRALFGPETKIKGVTSHQ